MRNVVYQLYSASVVVGLAATATIARDGRIKGVVAMAGGVNAGAPGLVVSYTLALNEPNNTSLPTTNNPPREVLVGAAGYAIAGGANAAGYAVVPNTPCDIPIKAGDTLNVALNFVGALPNSSTVRFLVYVAENS